MPCTLAQLPPCMQEIDDELLTRAARWCAEAGRPSDGAEIRAAFAPLSWDELLAVRALLADPPPARPLGPRALADIARGTPPEIAAGRERGDRGGPIHPAGPGPAPEPKKGGRAPRERAKRPRPAAGPVIRRARDRMERERLPPAPPQRPDVDELFASEGRAVLERLLREHGARRGTLCSVMSAGWQHAGGGPVVDGDLERLLDVHGLARAFQRRERDELLHALRAAAGLKGRAAVQVGLSLPAFDAALERLRAGGQAEAIRAGHREELRRRGTLSERVRLLLGDSERLADLGLLEEFQADLRQRLPEHLRALRASGSAPIDAALARSLSIGPRDLEALVARLGISLGEAPTRAPARHSAPPPHAVLRQGAPATARSARAGPARDRAGRGARLRPQGERPGARPPGAQRTACPAQQPRPPRPPPRSGPKRR